VRTDCPSFLLAFQRCTAPKRPLLITSTCAFGTHLHDTQRGSQNHTMHLSHTVRLDASFSSSSCSRAKRKMEATRAARLQSDRATVGRAPGLFGSRAESIVKVQRLDGVVRLDAMPGRHRRKPGGVLALFLVAFGCVWFGTAFCPRGR